MFGAVLSLVPLTLTIVTILTVVTNIVAGIERLKNTEKMSDLTIRLENALVMGDFCHDLMRGLRINQQEPMTLVSMNSNYQSQFTDIENYKLVFFTENILPSQVYGRLLIMPANGSSQGARGIPLSLTMGTGSSAGQVVSCYVGFPADGLRFIEKCADPNLVLAGFSETGEPICQTGTPGPPGPPGGSGACGSTSTLGQICVSNNNGGAAWQSPP